MVLYFWKTTNTIFVLMLAQTLFKNWVWNSLKWVCGGDEIVDFRIPPSSCKKWMGCFWIPVCENRSNSSLFVDCIFIPRSAKTCLKQELLFRLLHFDENLNEQSKRQQKNFSTFPIFVILALFQLAYKPRTFPASHYKFSWISNSFSPPPYTISRNHVPIQGVYEKFSLF